MTGDRSIDLVNVGPIERLRLPIPEDGGVVILRGQNGVGKSTALEGVHALTGGADPLSVRDGAQLAEIVGLGASLVVSKRRSLTGELSVESIASDLEPGALIDPGIKDPEAADMERARVLCALADVRPGLGIFEEIPDVSSIAGERAREAKTLPEMAKFLKRDLEENARLHEEAAGKLERELQALRGRIEGVDLEAESDEAILRVAESDARSNLAQIETKIAICVSHRATARLAKEKLDELLANPFPITSKEAQEKIERQLAAAAEMQIQIGAARRELIKLEEGIDASEELLQDYGTNLNTALAYEKHVADLRAILEQNPVEPPNPEDFSAAQNALTKAEMRREQGAVVRHALAAFGAESKIVPEHRKAIQRAEAMRAAAARVWSIVAEAVSRAAPEGLTIKDGRVMLKTDRGDELFAELSDGERASIALTACIKATPEGGLLTIPQGIWEGLDPERRAMTHSLARSKRITVLTAEASAGELRAEPFDER